MINKKFLLKVSIFLLLFLMIGFWVTADSNKLMLSTQNEPNSLDPHRLDSTMAQKTAAFMYDTLVMTHPETREIIPGLAKSWEISEDGLVATFHIREGVKFHDGKPLTAEDFKYTYERAMNPATRATYVRNLIMDLERIEVVDELTFKLIYREPLVNLLSVLTLPENAPINRNSVETQGDEFGTNPVGAGTGPYKFKSWQAAQAINFVRNEYYNWGPEFYENQGPPHIEEIELKIIQDLEVQTMAVLKEEIDIADFTPAKDVAAYEAHSNIDLVGIEMSGIGLYSAFNVSKPPFDDPMVRKAASHAVDRQAIIDVVKLGQAKMVYAPIPPFWFGYNKKVEDYYEYDPEKAKKMLDEAGWKVGPDGIRQKDGVRLEGDFLVRQREDYINTAQMIQEMFKEVGISLKIQILEWGTLVEGIHTGKHHYTLMGHSRTSTEAIMYQYFHSDNVEAWNLVKIADESLDKRIDEARRTIDTEKRREMIEEFMEIVMIEKCLWLPIYNDVEYDPVNKRVQGMVWNPLMWLYPNDARILE